MDAIVVITKSKPMTESTANFAENNSILIELASGVDEGKCAVDGFYALLPCFAVAESTAG